jgi:hypothetical protein
MLRLPSDFLAAVKSHIDLTWLQIRIVAITIWEDKRVRFLTWLLALGLTVWQAISGRLGFNDIVNEILLGFIFSMPFRR